MSVKALMQLSSGDNPSPVLVFEERGMGASRLACQAGREWSGGSLQDFSAHKLVAASGGEGVDVRELIRELSLKSPGRRAVVVNLNGASLVVQNALLKSLEEPPASTLIILVADSGYAVLPTIRSRCQVYQFPLMSQAELVSWAESKGVEFQKEDIVMAGGNPERLLWVVANRDIVQAMLTGSASPVVEELNSQDDKHEWIDNLLAALFNRRPSQALAEARGLALSGVRPDVVLASLLLV